MRIDLRAAALLAGLAFGAGGCAVSDGPREASGVGADQGQLVARDFVAALAQLRGYDPRNTTVQMRSARTPFGEALAGELRRAGYGMQLVADDESAPLLVSWESDGFENVAGRSVGYRLRIGAIELGREYELRAGRVFPMTALSVRGVPIGREPLDDGIFDRNRRPLQALSGDRLEGAGARETGAVAATGAPLAAAGLIDEGSGRPTSSDRDAMEAVAAADAALVVTQDAGPSERAPADSAFGARVQAAIRARGPEGPDGSASGTRGTFVAERTDRVRGGAATEESNDISARVHRNVLEIGRSNFAPLLDGYDVAEEHVLVFPDDSLRLGEANKGVLRAVAARIDPATDLVSVLGCSHGPTAVEGGNELLATGRAHRVKEALVRAGVDAGVVLDEGCWASTAQPDRPARAVVVARRTRGPVGRRS